MSGDGVMTYGCLLTNDVEVQLIERPDEHEIPVWDIAVIAVGVNRLDPHAVINIWRELYAGNKLLSVAIAPGRRSAIIGNFLSEDEALLAVSLVEDYMEA